MLTRYARKNQIGKESCVDFYDQKITNLKIITNYFSTFKF